VLRLSDQAKPLLANSINPEWIVWRWQSGSGCGFDEKKGSHPDSPFSFMYRHYASERESPVQKCIDPISAFANASSSTANPVHSEVLSSAGSSRTQIRCVIPQHVQANAHAGIDKIPNVPLSQQYPGSVKLTAVNIAASCRVLAPQVVALKVSPDQNRSRRRR
jgi:hypothetical protein